MSAAEKHLNVVEHEFKGGDPGPRKEDVAALGFSIQIDFGAGRTGVLQTHLSNDCSLIDLNRMLDKMTAAGDRQRAHYKIEEEERALESIEKDQRQHAEDIVKVDADFLVAQEQRREEIRRAESALADSVQMLANAHIASGRRGEFELRGKEKSNAAVAEARIKQLKEEYLNKQAEHDDTHKKFNELRKRRQDLIEKHKVEIDRLRAIVASGLR